MCEEFLPAPVVDGYRRTCDAFVAVDHVQAGKAGMVAREVRLVGDGPHAEVLATRQVAVDGGVDTVSDGVETGVVAGEWFCELATVAEGDDVGDLPGVRGVEPDVLERPVDETGAAFGPRVSEFRGVPCADLRGEVRAEQVQVGVALGDGRGVLPVHARGGDCDVDGSDDAYELRGFTFQAFGGSRAALEHEA